MLGLWFLAQALRRVCEDAYRFVYTLLEELLGQFEDIEAKERAPVSSMTGPLQGETKGIEAIGQCAPSVSANPSSHVEILPSKAQPIAGSGLVDVKDFKEEVVWQSFFKDPSQWWDNRFDKGTLVLQILSLR